MPIKNKESAQQFVKFCLVGVVNTSLNYAVYALFLLLFHVPYLVAGAIGFLSGAISGFYLNRAWTFKVSCETRSYLPKYMLINVFSMAVNALCQYVLVECAGMPAIYSQLFGIAVTTVLNFGLSRMLFCPPKDD